MKNRVRPLLWASLLMAIPGPVSAQDATSENGALSTADSIRAAYAAQQPPGDYGTDWVDIAGFPFKLIGLPFDLVLVRLPAFMVGQFTVPRPPNFVMRALAVTQEAGVRPGVRAGVGPQSGIGGGILVDRWDPLYLNTSISVRGSQRHEIGLAVGDDEAGLTARFRWQRDARARFFGIGSRTSDEEFLFRRDVVDAGLSGRAEIAKEVSVEADVGYEDNFIREPLSPGDDPSIFDEFDSDDLFAGDVRQEFVRVGGAVDLDLTHRSGFQTRGLAFRAAGQVFRGVRGTEADFHRLEFVSVGHLPLNERQELALRGQIELLRASKGSVPFYHLSGLGGKENSIGYSTSRFRDLDLAALTAEWRYEIWRDIHNTSRIETFLYFGEGAVAPRLGEIESADWHESYGFGFRATGSTGLLGLIYFGFSEESFHFGFSQEWYP